jgi:opacity protein-like surface antigen
MRNKILCLAIVSLIFAICEPQLVLAQGKANAISVKAGKYEPTDDIDDLGLSGDLYGAISYNYYVSPRFALEFGIGKYDAEETFTGFDPVFLDSFSEKDEVSAIPLTINAKGILPLNWGELYGGGGLGIYFADFEADIQSSAQGPASISDSDTVFGFQLLAGILFNITPSFYLGIEGQYIITADAEASGVLYGVPVVLEGNLNGYTFSGVVGFRF